MESVGAGAGEEGGGEEETVMVSMPAVAASMGSVGSMGSQRAWVGCMFLGYCMVFVWGS